MHYYKRHIGDYLKNTAHLTLTEHGVYSRLMDVYYTTEKPIKDHDKYRCISARTKQEKEAVDVILSEFFEFSDGVWIQERCEEDIEKYNRRATANKQNGMKGGAPKKCETPT